MTTDISNFLTGSETHSALLPKGMQDLGLSGDVAPRHRAWGSPALRERDLALHDRADRGLAVARRRAVGMARAAVVRSRAGSSVDPYAAAHEFSRQRQYLTDTDARAIAHYLKALPAQRAEGSFQPGSNASRGAIQGNRTGDVESTGASVYRSFCSQCHQADGRGIARVFPRLAGNPSVLSDDASSLIRLTLEGGRSPGTQHGPMSQSMPGYAGTLTDVHLAQVLTHVRQAWGNDAKPVTTSDVAKLRKSLRR